MNHLESEYLQVTKELLAVTFSCSKFHNYKSSNNNITIDSDHMPLVSLMPKPLCKIHNNVFWWLRLKLISYQFTLTCLSGKRMFTADFLVAKIHI